MYFCELKKEEFQQYASSHPLKSFVQTRYMGDYQESVGNQVYYVGVKEKNTILCAAMVIAHNASFFGKVFYAPNGFLIDFEDMKLMNFFTKQMKKFVRKKRGYVLIIDPYYPLKEYDPNGNIIKNNCSTLSKIKKLGYHYRKNSSQVKYMFVLDLENKTKEQILKDMKSTTRSCIQKSFKKGIVFRELNYEELEEFKKLTSYSSKKHHFQDRSLEYYQKMYRIFPKNLIKYVVSELHVNDYQEELETELSKLQEEIKKVKKEGRKKDLFDQINQLNKTMIEVQKLHKKKIILSGAMFLLYGDEVIYLFSGNVKEATYFCTAYRIQWEMIQYALQNHYKRYNFYGITNMNENNGVYKFKKGFNGKVIELIGEFELPTHFNYYIRNILSKLRLNHKKSS